MDRLFWVVTRRLWPQWKQALVIVTPETVVRWHRAGFRLYWNWISRHRKAFGRKRISKELRELIFRMVAENPTWGAPRIHGELLKLGSMFLSEPSLAGRSVHPRIRNQPRAGESSSKIIVKPSLRWISSLYQASRLEYCIVFS